MAVSYNQEPDAVLQPITSEECENLKKNAGLDGQGNNCDAFNNTLLPEIEQEVAYLASRSTDAFTIFTNDESKCDDDDAPTLASWWSRIYRFSQAVTCILCQYDPFLTVLLKSGRYPQILMGAASNSLDASELGCHQTGYPVWVNPDDYPVEGSPKPVTSDGVYKAVQDAILSVWHLWEEHPEFDFFAQSVDDPNDLHNLASQTGMVSGDTALVTNDGTEQTVLYEYDGTDWVSQGSLDQDNLTNFAVTHINKGYYQKKDVYYFGTGEDETWQVMDVHLTELEMKVEELKNMFTDAVLSGDAGTEYLLTTRATLAEANLVQPTSGKTTIVLITG